MVWSKSIEAAIKNVIDRRDDLESAEGAFEYALIKARKLLKASGGSAMVRIRGTYYMATVNPDTNNIEIHAKDI